MSSIQLEATFTADAQVLRLCKNCGERKPADELNENQRCADCAQKPEEQP